MRQVIRAIILTPESPHAQLGMSCSNWRVFLGIPHSQLCRSILSFTKVRYRRRLQPLAHIDLSIPKPFHFPALGSSHPALLFSQYLIILQIIVPRIQPHCSQHVHPGDQ